MILNVDKHFLQGGHQCRVTISNIPRVLTSQNVISYVGKKKKKWGYCKHLYYVFRLLCKVDCDGDEFIHAPTYTCDEVMRLVELDGVV